MIGIPDGMSYGLFVRTTLHLRFPGIRSVLLACYTDPLLYYTLYLSLYDTH